MATPWKCGPCGYTNKANAEYCPHCGSHWSSCNRTYTGDGWQGKGSPWTEAPRHQGDWRPKSPRRRPKSPRARVQGGKGAGKGHQKSGPKGGKPATQTGTPGAGAAGATPTVEAPTMATLPAAPSQPVVPLPRGQAAAASNSADQRIIQAFMEHLSKQDVVSEELRELMAKVSGTSMQQETKELHKLVKARSEACSALHQINTDRGNFEAAWATYTQSLVTLLQDQLAKRQSTLEKLDRAEAEWTGKLREVTAQIKQATGTKPVSAEEAEEVRSSSSEEMEVAVTEDAERAAKREKREQEMLYNHQQLLSALQKVHSTASAQAERRDGSRTPRRSKDTPQLAEVKKEPGMGPTVPASAAASQDAAKEANKPSFG
eukprot:s645_g19.t1